MNMRKHHLAVAAAVALAVSACTTPTPREEDPIERARAAVEQVENLTGCRQVRRSRDLGAHVALAEAEQLKHKDKPEKDVRQAAYVAKRHADIAAEQITRGQAEEKSAAAEAERQKVVLQAREQEATNARAQAEAARAQAQSAQTAGAGTSASRRRPAPTPRSAIPLRWKRSCVTCRRSRPIAAWCSRWATCCSIPARRR